MIDAKETTNTDDVIDVRDIIERFEQLEGERDDAIGSGSVTARLTQRRTSTDRLITIAKRQAVD